MLNLVDVEDRDGVAIATPMTRPASVSAWAALQSSRSTGSQLRFLPLILAGLIPILADLLFWMAVAVKPDSMDVIAAPLAIMAASTAIKAASVGVSTERQAKADKNHQN